METENSYLFGFTIYCIQYIVAAQNLIMLTASLVAAFKFKYAGVRTRGPCREVYLKSRF